jgi:hypothetical protein
LGVVLEYRVIFDQLQKIIEGRSSHPKEGNKSVVGHFIDLLLRTVLISSDSDLVVPRLTLVDESGSYLACEEAIASREPIARSQISNRWENRIDNSAEFLYLQWN